MTDHDLRDLLRDQVADLTTTPDLSAGAWSAARGVRRRRALGVVSASAVAAVLVVGGVAVLGDRSGGSPTPAPTPSPEPSQVVTTPDGRFQGAPVYWSPSLAEEAGLPLMTEGRPPLPEEIDMSAEATPVEGDPIDRASAAFGIIDEAASVRVLLLSPDGSHRSLDLSDVGPDPLISCCQRPAVREWMLSPTGEYLVFPQIDGLMIYDLPKDEWRQIVGSAEAAGTWVSDTELNLHPFSNGGRGPVYDVATGERTGTSDLDLDDNDADLALDLGRQPSHRFGPAGTAMGGRIQSWGSGAELPVPEGTPPNPEFLIAYDGQTTILTFTGTPRGDRWLQCCPVVGWAGEGVAMYESRSSTPRIIAWDVGSQRFQTVSEITGFTPGQWSYIASYPELWR